MSFSVNTYFRKTKRLFEFLFIGGCRVALPQLFQLLQTFASASPVVDIDQNI